MSFNNGKKRTKTVWAVVDNDGFVSWTKGSHNKHPRMMVYSSETYALRNMRHAPKVEGITYSVKCIYFASPVFSQFEDKVIVICEKANECSDDLCKHRVPHEESIFTHNGTETSCRITSEECPELEKNVICIEV